MIEKLKTSSLARFFVIFIVGLLFAQILVAVRISTMGRNLAQLESKWAQLVWGSQRLEESIAYHTALATIASKSAELGFVKPTQIIYLSSGSDQALLGSGQSFKSFLP